MFSACGKEPEDVGTTISIDKGNERMLLSYYVGGMLSAEGQDPFEAGALSVRSNTFYVDIDMLAKASPGLDSELELMARDGKVEWEELASFVNTHYYAYRRIPESLILLIEQTGDWQDDSEWLAFEVDGVMSPHRRRIHVRLDDLREALLSYSANGANLRYPIGTTFVSEHMDNGLRVEVSVMRKRSDGFWDFFAYGDDGLLVGVIDQIRKDLVVPTQCVGCHFGSRLFEPEKSFPREVADGPDGPRKLYVGENLRDDDVIRLLDEHRRRSDTVLGLYGTLFLSRLRVERRSGVISEQDKQILESMGL